MRNWIGPALAVLLACIGLLAWVAMTGVFGTGWVQVSGFVALLVFGLAYIANRR